MGAWVCVGSVLCCTRDGGMRDPSRMDGDGGDSADLMVGNGDENEYGDRASFDY